MVQEVQSTGYIKTKKKKPNKYCNMSSYKNTQLNWILGDEHYTVQYIDMQIKLSGGTRKLCPYSLNKFKMAAVQSFILHTVEGIV